MQRMQKIYDQGCEHLKNNDFQQAVQCFEEACYATPGKPHNESLAKLGAIYYHGLHGIERNEKKAEKYLSAAAKQTPGFYDENESSADSLYHWGLVELTQKGRPHVTARLWRKAIQIWERNTECMDDLTRTKLELEQLALSFPENYDILFFKALAFSEALNRFAQSEHLEKFYDLCKKDAGIDETIHPKNIPRLLSPYLALLKTYLPYSLWQPTPEEKAFSDLITPKETIEIELITYSSTQRHLS
jgi:tetratricopeptide (TPR) repeat protein